MFLPHYGLIGVVIKKSKIKSLTINGYLLEIVQLPPPRDFSLFITLTDKKYNRIHFSLTNDQGEWHIRNPLTVPDFVREIEKDIVEHL